MQPFSSKQLYMMNGGDKVYIYKDGFGDVYDGTPEEESAWREELMAQCLQQLDTETNPTCLEACIRTLHFHHQQDLKYILIGKLSKVSLQARAVIAERLRILYGYTDTIL